MGEFRASARSERRGTSDHELRFDPKGRSPRHVPDSSLNRAMLRAVSSDPRNLLSTQILPDGSKLEKFAGNLPNGAQVWANVRDGIITNGGIRPASSTNPPANPF
jgi:hypothetical protein